MTRSAFVFPGQGAYLPGVLTDLTGHPEVRDALDVVDGVAARLRRRPVSGLLTDPGAPGLDELAASDPASLHLAIYATGIAATRLLTEHHGITPDLLVGHSFGELIGLAASGVFSVEDGAHVVAQRDEALGRLAATPGGMVALNTGHRRARHLIGAVDAWDLAIAADNTPSQVVVSGPHDQLDQLVAAADALGITATRLRVPYPFHNRLLAAAADDFGRRIAEVPRRHPRVPVYSPLLSRYIGDNADVDALAAGHLTTATRFLDAVRTVHGHGVTRFVECGAKSVCTGFVNAIVVGADTIAPLRTRADAARLRATLVHDTGDARITPMPARELDRPVPPPASASAAVPPLDDVFDTARSVYAELVGYPPEVFEPDSDLESDLGIDSLKQVEGFTRLLRRCGLDMPDPRPRLTSHTTLSAITRLVAEIHQRQAS